MTIPAPASYLNRNAWGGGIWLLTPEEFDALPDGTVVVSIMGKEVTKGPDFNDYDTRFGVLAYGLHKDQFQP